MKNSEPVYLIHVFYKDPVTEMFRFSHVYHNPFTTPELAQKFINVMFAKDAEHVLYQVIKVDLISSEKYFYPY